MTMNSQAMNFPAMNCPDSFACSFPSVASLAGLISSPALFIALSNCHISLSFQHQFLTLKPDPRRMRFCNTWSSSLYQPRPWLIGPLLFYHVDNLIKQEWRHWNSLRTAFHLYLSTETSMCFNANLTFFVESCQVVWERRWSPESGCSSKKFYLLGLWDTELKALVTSINVKLSFYSYSFFPND